MKTQEIIKRLELIKNLLLLEEYETLALQVNKLKSMTDNYSDKNANIISEIISLIEAEKYSDIIKIIEKFTSENSGIGIYKDPETEVLKIELKNLERSVTDYSSQHQELENTISQFEIRYHQELGELIGDILQLKKEQLKDSPDKDAFKQAEEEYDQFHNQHEVLKGKYLNVLSEDDKSELKKLYRKAAGLCHPDKVSEEQREKAKKLFQELNNANANNDLDKVREILSFILNGVLFSNFADTVNEKERLRAEVIRLRRIVDELKGKIASIKSSEVYQKIISISDLDIYFTNLKTQLEDEFNKLKDLNGV